MTQSILDISQSQLLTSNGIGDSELSKIFTPLQHKHIDYADVYFQQLHHEAWVLDEGIIKSGSSNISQGVGIRVTSEEKTGFSYTNSLSMDELSAAASAARSIAIQGQNKRQQVNSTNQNYQNLRLYTGANPLESLSNDKKVNLLKNIDIYARSLDPRIEEVSITLSGVYEVIYVAMQDGLRAADIRPLVRLNVSVIAAEKDRRESGNGGGGGRFDYHYFLQKDRTMQYAKQAVQQALTNLSAVDAPAGTLNVVLGPGWPGILLHEAVGHGLEGDFNRKGTSLFSGRIGEQVAANQCTIIDDGTIPDRRGSLQIDDEGMPTQKNVLIENGILKGYMQDNLNARLMGMAPTGNGRRESYAHLPMPRMTNTYMAAGKYDPGEILASLDKGVYFVNFSGGQVDITSGNFVFSASEAYLVDKGKIIRPVRGATLIGNGPEAMSRISMVGNDLKLDSGIGTCGKEGQSVPVGVGQPTIRLDGITVGGVQR